MSCHKLLPHRREHNLDATASQNPNLTANYSEAEDKINLLTDTTILPLSCLEILTAFKVIYSLNIPFYTTFVSPSSLYSATETPGMHEVATRVYNSQYSSPKNQGFCKPLNYEALMKNIRSAHEVGSYSYHCVVYSYLGVIYMLCLTLPGNRHVDAFMVKVLDYAHTRPCLQMPRWRHSSPCPAHIPLSEIQSAFF